MQDVLVANQKRLVQGRKNGHSHRATKNVECAKVFLPFILHAYECCIAKLICVRYQKLLRAANIRRKFCTPGVVTRC